jgi:hypothetical protein
MNLGRMLTPCFMFTAFFGPPVSASAAPPAVQDRPGQTALLYRVDKKSDFSFSARLTLPQVATNKGQYSIWIMVGELKDSPEKPATVQSGLMWWKPDKFVFQPFVEVELSGGNPQYSLPAPLTNSTKEHEFRITRTRDNISVSVDSKRIFNAPWSTYFSDDMHIYLRIASEVFADEDTVSGTVRDIGLTTSKGTTKPFTPAIADVDRGLQFVCNDHMFVATGKFDSDKPFSPRWFWPPPCEGSETRTPGTK